MNKILRSNHSGFTLVEIMIVVAIIGLLAVIAVPGFIRSRQLAQGRALINDARQIDAAVDQWAVETGQIQGATPNCASLSVYLKVGTLQSKVAALGAAGGNITDVLTIASITIGNIGSTQVRITSTAKAALPAITDWGNY